LCGLFSAFYEKCPVLKAGDAATVNSRLILCRVTQAVLKIGLQELLGIPVLDEM
jgi:arginyl-tRNA synthetase